MAATNNTRVIIITMAELDIITPSLFDKLFVDDTPMIDVRSPAEFAKGAFPFTTNLPILNDNERRRVGLRYKELGLEAARSLGHSLVSGRTRNVRIEAWKDFREANNNTVLYCFRGGARSRIACEWLASRGVSVPLVVGGYKAMRQHLLDVYQRLPNVLLVSGRTGSGKTTFLSNFENAIDLEWLANHRGSAFGGNLSPQPTQIDFENSLAICFLKKRSQSEILLEDEGHLIGRINLPSPLQDAMKTSPIIVIEEPVKVRTKRIYHEYIVRQWQNYQDYFKLQAEVEFEKYLLSAIDAIRKRLGGLAHQQIRQQMVEACKYQKQNGCLELHLRWINALLVDYYDPMYDYQITKKASRVLARDSRLALLEWYNYKLSDGF